MAIESLPTRLALALMCVLSFEGCALVRQRQQQASGSAAAAQGHAALENVLRMDTLAECLQIVLDSLEYEHHIHFDTLVLEYPSQLVKVRATKATITRNATQRVTTEELNLTSDTTTFHAVAEQQVQEQSQSDYGGKPPNWTAILIAAIIVLSLLAWAYAQK